MITITEEQIDELAKNAKHQSDIVIGLYKLVFPDFDKMESVGGFPKCSKETAEYIFMVCIDFDRTHHPDVVNGGLWMNNGFSTLNNDGIKDWEIDISECSPTYLEDLSNEKEKD